MLFQNVLLSVGFTICARVAVAQSASPYPTNVAGYAPCILGCFIPAASANNCRSFSDLNCVCNSAQFQADAMDCLKAHCNSTEVEDGRQIQVGQCIGKSVTATTGATAHTISFATFASQTPTATGRASALDVHSGTFFGALAAVVFAL